MAGRRPLTAIEERKLLKVTRRLSPRDRAFITAQWLMGFRLSETLRLRIGDIYRDGEIVDKVGIAPRNMKGVFGRTRWVPVLPELHRALESYLGWLRHRIILHPDLPLFDSRVARADGTPKAIGRDRARLIIKRAFAKAGIFDDGRLGSHSFRKCWAMHVYKNSGNCILTVKAALNHSSVEVSQAYLSVEEEDVVRAIRGCDFTRKPRAVPACISSISCKRPTRNRPSPSSARKEKDGSPVWLHDPAASLTTYRKPAGTFHSPASIKTGPQ